MMLVCARLRILQTYKGSSVDVQCEYDKPEICGGQGRVHTTTFQQIVLVWQAYITVAIIFYCVLSLALRFTHKHTISYQLRYTPHGGCPAT